MKIEILCTGDEILTGKTVNTNHSYIAQRLTENALTAHWGTTVGDDRDSLTKSFLQASERADAVIVNGGLGPTVDDLSQEVAASAAGVELECHHEWLERLKAYYSGRGRSMPENNVKQAMLPAGAEFIDNPIGTACGFAIDINGTRFFFTPGVPREMYRMIGEQVIPRLLAMRGTNVTTRLKRFHTFGIGESRADQLLADIIQSAESSDSSVKLGFQSHYPQLETKLSAQAPDEKTLNALLAPVEAEVRRRLGNFVLCEDDSTLETTILDYLATSGSTLSVVETITGGAIANRLIKSANSDQVLTRCVSSHHLNQLLKSAGEPENDSAQLSTQTAAALAVASNAASGSTHSLVVLTGPGQSTNGQSTNGQSTNGQNQNDQNQDNQGIDIYISVAGPSGNCERYARLPGRIGWVRSGATEMGLDCLRRHLFDLPIDEKIDFEVR